MTLVNEELLEKLVPLSGSIMDVVEAKRQANDRDNLEAAAALDTAWQEVMPSYDDVRNILTKISFTQRRCALVSPRSGYWAILFHQVDQVWIGLRALNPSPHGRGRNRDQYELARIVGQINMAQSELSETLSEITEPVRPPKQPPHWRATLYRQRLEGRYERQPDDRGAAEQAA